MPVSGAVEHMVCNNNNNNSNRKQCQQCSIPYPLGFNYNVWKMSPNTNTGVLHG